MMYYKNFVDCHTHCNFSDDSRMLPEDGVKRAIELGLHGITFTDHIDFDYPNPAYTFHFDPAKRLATLTALQHDVGNTIKILNGVEIGIQPHVIEKSNDFIANGNFDFVINSVHAIDGSSLCSQGTFFAGKTKKQAYDRYLTAIYDCITQFTNFDIVGHIGYIRRYGPYPDNSLRYHEYADIIDAILKKVITDGKGIEINTSGYAYHLGSPIPDIDIIRRYKELGGEIITMGSDSHTADHIGNYFEEAIAILQQAGFSQVAYFVQRKPIFVPLAAL